MNEGMHGWVTQRVAIGVGLQLSPDSLGARGEPPPLSACQLPELQHEIIEDPPRAIEQATGNGTLPLPTLQASHSWEPQHSHTFLGGVNATRIDPWQLRLHRPGIENPSQRGVGSHVSFMSPHWACTPKPLKNPSGFSTI